MISNFDSPCINNEVNKILKEIGADTIPQILILNKVDLAHLSLGSESCIRDEYDRIMRIRLSAKTGEGIEFVKQAFMEAIAEHTKKNYEKCYYFQKKKKKFVPCSCLVLT